MGSAKQVTGQNFRETVEQGGIVLLDFWAPWCGPCRSFAPIFEKVAADNPDLTFGKVNTDEETELAGAFDIQSIPTLMVFRDRVLLYSAARRAGGGCAAGHRPPSAGRRHGESPGGARRPNQEAGRRHRAGLRSRRPAEPSAGQPVRPPASGVASWALGGRAWHSLLCAARPGLSADGGASRRYRRLRPRRARRPRRNSTRSWPPPSPRPRWPRWWWWWWALTPPATTWRM